MQNFYDKYKKYKKKYLLMKKINQSGSGKYDQKNLDENARFGFVNPEGVIRWFGEEDHKINKFCKINNCSGKININFTPKQGNNANITQKYIIDLDTKKVNNKYNLVIEPYYPTNKLYIEMLTAFKGRMCDLVNHDFYNTIETKLGYKTCNAKGWKFHICTMKYNFSKNKESIYKKLTGYTYYDLPVIMIGSSRFNRNIHINILPFISGFHITDDDIGIADPQNNPNRYDWFYDVDTIQEVINKLNNYNNNNYTNQENIKKYNISYKSVINNIIIPVLREIKNMYNEVVTKN
jgi:hypothetical protein